MTDKEKIRQEIERRLSNIVTGLDFTAEIELKGLLAFLDALPEQPKLKPMNITSGGGEMGITPPSYKLDVKPEQLIGSDDENAADKKAVKEIVKTVRKEVTRQVKEIVDKQPVEGLEEEISRTYHDGSVTDTEEIDHVSYENIARHFAEWGKNNLK